MNVRLASRWAIVATSVVLLSSCGSKGTPGFGLPAHLVPSPDPLNLSGTGAGHAGTMVATEPGYTGTISTSTTCSSGSKPIASISPTSGNAPLTVTVTPENTGTCTITFSDTLGLTHTAAVNVTNSGIGVSSRSRN